MVGAIDLLRQQHRDVEQLFEQLRTADRRTKVSLLGRLAEDLTVHAALEEKFFYPLAEQDPDLKDRIAHARREHESVRQLISDLMEVKQTDPRMGEMIGRLEKTVRDHVEEEERDLFPRLEADAGRMEQMGDEMRRAQAEMRDQEILDANA